MFLFQAWSDEVEKGVGKRETRNFTFFVDSSQFNVTICVIFINPLKFKSVY